MAEDKDKKKRPPGRPEEPLKAPADDWEDNLDRILKAGAPRERKPKKGQGK